MSGFDYGSVRQSDIKFCARCYRKVHDMRGAKHIMGSARVAYCGGMVSLCPVAVASVTNFIVTSYGFILVGASRQVRMFKKRW